MRAIPVLFAFMLAVPVFAAGRACEMSTSSPEFDSRSLGIFEPRVYIDLDLCQPGCDVPLPWIYQESNGIPGLQRADEVVDDTCGGTAGPGDTIVF